MEKYICSVCGFLYDEETAERNPEGQLIPFQDLKSSDTSEWSCPNCGVNIDLFVPADKVDNYKGPEEEAGPGLEVDEEELK